MNEELLKKANMLMYYLTKEAARSSFVEFLEETADLNGDEWKEIKKELGKIGITKFYC
jgi:hypothetical protein